MNVAGIDAHSTYVVVTIVNNTGKLVHEAQRIRNVESAELVALLERYRPIEAVVETSPAWPWLYDLLQEHGIGFVLAHAKELEAISGQNDKRDAMDAELLARICVAGLVPEVHAKPPALRGADDATASPRDAGASSDGRSESHPRSAAPGWSAHESWASADAERPALGTRYGVVTSTHRAACAGRDMLGADRSP